ncbi:MAG TPA: hypothetical protein VJ995_00335 [Geothermobacteraceae bacterium]|nr:hypothetical protein [Geothermobacteraceae bacterium]
MMRWILAALFVCGLAMAGSEGPLFPWPNLAGLILILLFAALVRHLPLEEL